MTDLERWYRQAEDEILKKQRREEPHGEVIDFVREELERQGKPIIWEVMNEKVKREFGIGCNAFGRILRSRDIVIWIDKEDNMWVGFRRWLGE